MTPFSSLLDRAAVETGWRTSMPGDDISRSDDMSDLLALCLTQEPFVWLSLWKRVKMAGFRCMRTREQCRHALGEGAVIEYLKRKWERPSLAVKLVTTTF